MWTQIQIRAEQTHIVWNELIIYYIKNILTSGTNIDVTEKKTSENTKKHKKTWITFTLTKKKKKMGINRVK